MILPFVQMLSGKVASTLVAAFFIEMTLVAHCGRYKFCVLCATFFASARNRELCGISLHQRSLLHFAIVVRLQYLSH